MGIPCYLAMTRAEMEKSEVFPRHCGWMACHFSPYGTGLSNLPEELPPDSLLILNDRIPIWEHDPELICRQLRQCITSLGCQRLLLDFQQPGNRELTALVSHLTKEMPCPVGVSEAYAAQECCAVFLPPVPPSEPLAQVLSLWTGRDIWLELALEGEIVTLTEQGANTTPLPYPQLSQPGFRDDQLHCHYRTLVSDTQAEFTLWRTMDDLKDLLAEAEILGVTAATGLYQELNAPQMLSS